MVSASRFRFHRLFSGGRREAVDVFWRGARSRAIQKNGQAGCRRRTTGEGEDVAKSRGDRQKRVCRSCGQEYTYPVPKSLASRFYCDMCVELPREVRSVMERLNKRVTRLAARVEKLDKADK